MKDFYISTGNDGSMMWLAPIVVESVCHYNVRFFPYDSQQCTLSIGSWTYHGFQIDIYNKSATGVYQSLIPMFRKMRPKE